MNDELLMRFIDGTATPEEVETVIEMLSKDDEAAREWMQMAQAARLAGTVPAVPVSEQEAEKFVLQTLHMSETTATQPSRKVRRLPWIIASVASVAAAVAFIVSLSLNNSLPTSGGDVNNNLQAGIVPKDTTIVSIPSDTIVELQNTVQDIRQKEYLAENKEENTVVSKKQQIDQVSTAGKGAMTFQDTTAVGIETPVFNVLKPARSPYRVKVKNLDKDFVFEWESACVKSVNLVIVSSDGTVLFEKLMDSESRSCPVAASELTDKGKLKWTLTAVFEDETEVVREGAIELVSVL